MLQPKGITVYTNYKPLQLAVLLIINNGRSFEIITDTHLVYLILTSL